MPFDAVIAHLKASDLGLKKIAGAVDFASANATLTSAPAAFVLPLMDKASANSAGGGAVQQRVTVRFGVVLVVSNVRDALGAAAHTDLQTVRRAVIDALLAWRPTSEYDPCEYGGGRMLALNGADLWWQLEFVTAYYERKV